MAKLVDAPASGAGAFTGVEVRVLFRAPNFRRVPQGEKKKIDAPQGRHFFCPRFPAVLPLSSADRMIRTPPRSESCFRFAPSHSPSRSAPSSRPRRVRPPSSGSASSRRRSLALPRPPSPPWCRRWKSCVPKTSCTSCRLRSTISFTTSNVNAPTFSSARPGVF